MDASVALRWVLPDPLTVNALQLRAEYRAGVHQLIAPEIFVDEVARALTKAERQKLISVRRRCGAICQGHELTARSAAALPSR